MKRRLRAGLHAVTLCEGALFGKGRAQGGAWRYRRDHGTDAGRKKAGPQARLFIHVLRSIYFTPCISFWIKGASASRITPPASSDQKPKV